MDSQGPGSKEPGPFFMCGAQPSQYAAGLFRGGKEDMMLEADAADFRLKGRRSRFSGKDVFSSGRNFPGRHDLPCLSKDGGRKETSIVDYLQIYPFFWITIGNNS